MRKRPQNDKSSFFKVIVIKTLAPLLGLFSFGILTKRKVNDRLVPLICVLAPILSYILSANSEKLFGGYKISIEILLINGLITFAGLWVISKRGELTNTGKN